MFLQVKNNIHNSIKEDSENVKILSGFFKENKDISETFFAIDNLQHGITSGDIDDFIDFNINIIKKGKTLFESVSSGGGDLSQLDKSIEYLVENDKTATNYAKYESNRNFLKENIRLNNLNTAAESKISNILESLDNEEHKGLIQMLALAESKETFFNDIKDELVNTINEALLSGDKEIRYALLEAKEDVNKTLFNETTFVDNVVKLQEMKNVILS